MSARFLVTRTLPQAQSTAAAIRARGGEAFLAPMLSVRTIAADTSLEDVQILAFTSPNGVASFAAQTQAGRGLPASCVGEATAQAAREAGFQSVASADGDVAALTALIRRSAAPGAGKIVHVSGADTVGDLAGDLTAAGFTAERRIFYAADPADRLPPGIEARLAANPPGLDAVLFHSTRGARIFTGLANRLTPGALIAVCMSPAVAAAASVSPWKRVISAPVPTEDALLDTAFAQTGAQA